MTKRRRGGSDRQGGGFRVGPGTVVTLSYALLDAEGDLVEEGEPDAPLELLFGYGEAGPALERALEGVGVGQERSVRLDPAEAFGERETDSVISVDPAELPPDIALGDELEAEGEGGSSVPLKVVEVTPEAVFLDTNHPLSGQRVTLRVRVLAVRPARPEEIERAVERMTRASPPTQPLLPAEQLLRRKRAEPREGDEQPAGKAGENPVEKP